MLCQEVPEKNDHFLGIVVRGMLMPENTVGGGGEATLCKVKPERKTMVSAGT